MTANIRACKRFTGIEHNPAHFETACSRIRDAVERAPTITERKEETAA